MDANRFMVHIMRDMTQILEICDSEATFCEWLWDQRRTYHLMLFETDQSGSAHGWCTLSRMLVLSAAVKREYNIKSEFMITTNAHRRVLAKMGIQVTRRAIATYDCMDICMVLRLISIKWTAESMWKNGVEETVRWVELLLYDLSTRVETLWIEMSTHECLREEVKTTVFEVVRTIATIHAIIAFARHQILSLTDVSANVYDLVPTNRLMGDETPQHLYATGLSNLRAALQTMYHDNAKLGTMTESICSTVQCLIAPLDAQIRAHLKTGLRTEDILYATRQSLSVSEYVWLTTKMGSLTADKFWDPDSWEADQGWLIRAICHLRVIEVIINQFDTFIQWSAEAVLFDRDAFRVVSKKAFVTSPPLVFVYGCNFFVVHKTTVYRVTDLIEAFYVWVLILHTDYADMFVTKATASYDLKKEIGNVLDICYPKTVEHLMREDEALAADDTLDPLAYELLDTLGLLQDQSEEHISASNESPVHENYTGSGEEEEDDEEDEEGELEEFFEGEEEEEEEEEE